MVGEHKLNAIDLFSGCGGFSYGFESAGYNVILGVDNEPSALKTFEKNHKHSKGLMLDLHKDETIEEIINEIGDRDIDVVIGGPPCQGFSLSGTRDEYDDRNSLFYAFFKLAKRINPKAIVIENVTGIINLYKGKARKEIYRLCDEMGYTCIHKLLYAPDYGVPQIRKRVFFVALRKDIGEFEFPKAKYTESKYVTCEQAISDLPTLESDLGNELSEYIMAPTSEYQKLMRNGNKKLFNHVGTKHTDHVVDVISQVPEGGNHKDLPPGVGDSRKFNEAWTRYHSKKPSKTIDTGHRNHFHYKLNRVPTVRENARLQSFPDDFIFVGNKTQQNKQVGNAVPPLLGKAIGEKLKNYLK